MVAIIAIVVVVIVLLLVVVGAASFLVSTKPTQFVKRIKPLIARENVPTTSLESALEEGSEIISSLSKIKFFHGANESIKNVKIVLGEVCAKLSEIYQSKNDLIKSLFFQKKIFDMDGGDLKAKYRLGELYLKNSKIDETVKLIESIEKDCHNLSALISDKGNPELYKLKLEIAIYKKDYDAAEKVTALLAKFGNNYLDIIIDSYEKILQQKGPDKRFILPLADILMRKKSYKRACELYEKVQAETPEDENVVISLVTAAERSNNTQKAIEVLNNFLKHAKDKVKILKYLEHLYQRSGQNESLVNVYEQLIEIQPDVHSHYQSLIRIYKTLNRPKEAISTLQKLIKDDPDDPNNFFNLADICLQAGHSEEACLAYEKVLVFNEAKPDVNLIKQIMERIENYIKAKPEAIEAYNIIIRARSILRFDNSKYYYRLAKIFYKQKNYDQAFNELQKVSQSDEELNVKAAFLTGLCWIKRENYELAVRHFETLF